MDIIKEVKLTDITKEQIWELEKFPIGSIKGYILTLPTSEIKKKLEEDVFYLAEELNISI